MRLVDTGSTEKRLIILGVGNMLYRDEGLGVYIVRKLRGYHFTGNVTLIEAGTETIDAFLDAADTDRVIVIDAVQAGGVPGSIYRVNLGDISGQHGSSRTSLHEISLVDSYNMARILLPEIPEVIVIAVELESVEPGLGLSPSIRKKVDKIVDAVLLEVNNYLGRC